MKKYRIYERYYLDILNMCMCECDTLEEAKRVVDNHRDGQYLQWIYSIYTLNHDTNEYEHVEY